MPDGTPAAEQPKQARTAYENIPQITAALNDISRAVRTIEDKQYNLRKKVQLDAQNMLAANKKAFDEIKVINSDVSEIKREIEDIKAKILLVIQELKLTAKIEDVKVLQRYLELWEPAGFVTRGELDRVLEQKFKDKGL